jgi:hypothetical protein
LHRLEAVFCNLTPELRIRKAASAYREKFFSEKRREARFPGIFRLFIYVREGESLKNMFFPFQTFSELRFCAIIIKKTKSAESIVMEKCLCRHS